MTVQPHWPRLKFLRQTLTGPGTRDEIVALMDCAGVAIENTSQTTRVKIWDAASGGEWKQLRANEEKQFAFPLGRQVSKEHVHLSRQRFDAGHTICWAESESGSIVLVLTFML